MNALTNLKCTLALSAGFCSSFPIHPTASPRCWSVIINIIWGCFCAFANEYEMPQMLKDAGYYTFGIGKMHWYPQRVKHGFDGTLLDESGRRQDPHFTSDYRQWFQVQAISPVQYVGCSFSSNL